MTEALWTPSRRRASSARRSPVEIRVPPWRGAHGLEGNRISPLRLGSGMNRRAIGSSSREGVPGGSSSYATSEKPINPTGFPAAAILRSALTIRRYELPVMLYEKSIRTTLVPLLGRYAASVTPPPRANPSSSAAAAAIASASTRRAIVVRRAARRKIPG